MNVSTVNIKWTGPFTWEKAKEKKPAGDGFVYQMYGTHAIFGSDTLLYIGKTKGAFGKRYYGEGNLAWLDCQSSELSYYLGEINEKSDSVPDRLDVTETLLIFFCTPPYNSNKINGVEFGKLSNKVVVVNYGRHHRLPYVVSNLWDANLA